MKGHFALQNCSKIIIADDHPLFRGALKQALALPSEQDTTPLTIIEAGDFSATLVRLSENSDADLVLLDLAMPGTSGFSGLVSLRSQYAGIPVVIVSATDDQASIRRAMELGASGFIPKSSSMETIREAIISVVAGNVWTPPDLELGAESDPDVADLIASLMSLTPQQARVLTMLGEGLLNKQIAYELGVSEATVKAHVSAVLQKLNVDSRTQAVIRLSKIGVDVIES
jgi:DNA-binding NarL/FixJ family response regulator